MLFVRRSDSIWELRVRRKRLSRVGDREEGRRKEFARVEYRVRPGIYTYISAVTPLFEKILPPGALVAGNKDGFSLRDPPSSLFPRSPPFFLHFPFRLFFLFLFE